MCGVSSVEDCTEANFFFEQQGRVEAVPLEVGDVEFGAVHFLDDAVRGEFGIFQLFLEGEAAAALDFLLAESPVLAV